MGVLSFQDAKIIQICDVAKLCLYYYKVEKLVDSKRSRPFHNDLLPLTAYTLEGNL